MIIYGSVTGVDKLDQLNGDSDREPLVRVSIEGFSVLARPELQIPPSGMVRAEVSTRWKEGKRPTFWLDRIREHELA